MGPLQRFLLVRPTTTRRRTPTWRGQLKAVLVRSSRLIRARRLANATVYLHRTWNVGFRATDLANLAAKGLWI
jgi:hypothetical protein